MIKDLEGKEAKVSSQKKNSQVPLGQLYFDFAKLKINLDNIGRVAKDGKKKLNGYEKVRVVGKGAFGHAVLYRRKMDGLLVIIKEINMLDLSATDRQMSLNEVKV